MTTFIPAAEGAIDAALVKAKLPELHTVINNEFIEGAGEAFDVTYPGDSRIIASVKQATPTQVEQAVAAARRAQPGWAGLSASRRGQLLDHLADLIEADAERLAHAVALDNGKSLAGGYGDVKACLAFIRSAAGWTTRMSGRTLPTNGDSMTTVWREPAGVVGIILPYNAPLLFCGMKLAAAISVGNTVVAKTPEKTPLAPVLFMEYAIEAGIPTGVLNLVHGFGEVGSVIVDSDGTDMISFTGSSAVGSIIGAAASKKLKFALLELGGKSANIVFKDAPLEAAVSGSAAAIFKNAGQRCFAGSRLLLHEDIADEFIDSLVTQVAALQVGDPFSEGVEVAALAEEADIERIQKQVDEAVEQGARILIGGGKPEGSPEGGAFYQPTILEVPRGIENVDIVMEEVFGPVLVVQRFSTIDEAIALANESQYGLAGGCWTNSFSTAVRTAREINTGVFWINGYGTGGGPEATLGGRKRSGIGTEKGLEGLEQYTVLKTVMFPAGAEALPDSF